MNYPGMIQTSSQKIPSRGSVGWTKRRSDFEEQDSLAAQ